ncbi:MAG: exopolyphosphatase, partial [Saprospiraceae bacterium]
MKSPTKISDQAVVIDLGTNTFHFLAVALEAGGGWREVSRKQEYIRLAETGIAHIGPAPFDRALHCMISFREQVERLGIDEAKVRALGTAALRQAANAPDLIEAINRETGILVEVISGDREASLIARGVSLAVPLPNENALVMDIGGGSVEFIVMRGGEVLWQGSFMVGIALLLNKYRHSDPMGPAEIAHIESWL